MLLDLDLDFPAALADHARGDHVRAQDRDPAGGAFGAVGLAQDFHVAESVLQRQRQPAGFEDILRAHNRASGLIGLDHDDHKVGILALGRIGRGVDAHRGQAGCGFTADAVAADRKNPRPPGSEERQVGLAGQPRAEQAGNRAGAEDGDFHSSLS